jgi:hypothetical protein
LQRVALQLKPYFEKYIKNNINGFEKCEYNYKNCNKKICTEPRCEKDTPIYYGKRSHSLESFKAIAYELFCVSYIYSDFWNDIDELYKGSINKTNKRLIP